VLGYLPPVLLGGDMTLDVESARAAVAGIGEALGLSPEDAAQGIIDIANEVMLGALRVITVQRGLDPRDFGIVAFGGAGPLHANALAELLGCYPVVVPANPGVLSALGFLESEFKNEFVQTFIRSTTGLDEADVWLRFAQLEAKARRWLDEENVPASDQGLKYSMDLRYEQQGFEVSVDLNGDVLAERASLASVFETFHATHERLYGVRFHVPVELVALRVVATGPTLPVEEAAPASVSQEGSSAVIEMRPGYFKGRWVDTPNYDRSKLAVGDTVPGPAIIRQYDTTTVLLPDHFAEVDPRGNLLIWPNGKRN
jgi:N-methylhydantoinase A